MRRNFEINPVLPYQWVVMKDRNECAGVRERCTVSYLSAQIGNLDNLEVVSAELNESGIYMEEGKFFGFFDHTPEENLPAYYTVKLRKRIPGGRVANITVFLPLVWNERFIGLSGGGSATFMDYQQYLFSTNTPWTLAIRNHFACAHTDCSLDFYDSSWGLKKDSDEPDWDLLRAWGYDAAHDLAVIGKMVVEAVYGKKPTYSYIQGISAGGRTAHGEIQRYPQDYNGVWVQCAAAPWVLNMLTSAWSYLVMHNEKHPIAKAKFQAFYNGMLQQYGCSGKGYVDTCYFPEFSPYTMVGTDTRAGTITEKDAWVVKKIYDGPQYADGRKMPGCSSLGANVRYDSLIFYDETEELPIDILVESAAQAFRWVLGDPELTLNDITQMEIELIYERATSFKDLDNQDPDIRPFRDAGGKLILTHASSDYCLSLSNTLRYYNDMLRYVGPEEKARDFTRCFVSMGGGHGDRIDVGELMSYPDVWAALMKWVEDGEAPNELPTQCWDPDKQKVVYSGNTEKAYTVTHEENAKIQF